jgi:hypothetical protein
LPRANSSEALGGLSERGYVHRVCAALLSPRGVGQKIWAKGGTIDCQGHNTFSYSTEIAQRSTAILMARKHYVKAYATPADNAGNTLFFSRPPRFLRPRSEKVVFR